MSWQEMAAIWGTRAAVIGAPMEPAMRETLCITVLGTHAHALVQVYRHVFSVKLMRRPIVISSF